jgi:putative ATP-binding cassette transporter
MINPFRKIRDLFNGQASPDTPEHDVLGKDRTRLLSGSGLRTAYDATKSAMKLITPYWFRAGFAEGLKSWSLFAVAIACTVWQVDVIVDFSEWQRELFDNMQNEKPYMDLVTQDFPMILGQFLLAVGVGFRAAQEAGLRWRKWMTDQYTDKWLGNKAFYRLESVYKNSDNPDQRIQEDIFKFTNTSMTLATDATNSILTLTRFSAMLWAMSGEVNAQDIGIPVDYQIPGFMFWVGISFAAVGTWGINKIGNSLIKHNYNQQRYEADYRSELVRTRENAEQIALNDGEEVETEILEESFEPVVDNYRNLINKNEQVIVTKSLLSNISIPFPYVIAMQFAKGATWGVVMQTAYAFNRVQSALSWFIDNYQQLAEWKATADRLSNFTDDMKRSDADLALKDATAPLALPPPSNDNDGDNTLTADSSYDHTDDNNNDGTPPPQQHMRPSGP